MISINIGVECADRVYCDKECRYKNKDLFHKNICLPIRSFFRYKFHINLPYLICISKKMEKIMGTSKCPYNMEYDCEFNKEEII